MIHIPGFIFLQGLDCIGWDCDHRQDLENNASQLAIAFEALKASGKAVIGFNSQGWIKEADNVEVIVFNVLSQITPRFDEAAA